MPEIVENSNQPAPALLREVAASDILHCSESWPHITCLMAYKSDCKLLFCIKLLQTLIEVQGEEADTPPTVLTPFWHESINILWCQPPSLLILCSQLYAPHHDTWYRSTSSGPGFKEELDRENKKFQSLWMLPQMWFQCDKCELLLPSLTKINITPSIRLAVTQCQTCILQQQFISCYSTI